MTVTRGKCDSDSDNSEGYADTGYRVQGKRNDRGQGMTGDRGWREHRTGDDKNMGQGTWDREQDT